MDGYFSATVVTEQLFVVEVINNIHTIILIFLVLATTKYSYCLKFPDLQYQELMRQRSMQLSAITIQIT